MTVSVGTFDDELLPLVKGMYARPLVSLLSERIATKVTIVVEYFFNVGDVCLQDIFAAKGKVTQYDVMLLARKMIVMQPSKPLFLAAICIKCNAIFSCLQLPILYPQHATTLPIESTAGQIIVKAKSNEVSLRQAAAIIGTVVFSFGMPSFSKSDFAPTGTNTELNDLLDLSSRMNIATGLALTEEMAKTSTIRKPSVNDSDLDDIYSN